MSLWSGLLVARIYERLLAEATQNHMRYQLGVFAVWVYVWVCFFFFQRMSIPCNCMKAQVIQYTILFSMRLTWSCGFFGSSTGNVIFCRRHFNISNQDPKLDLGHECGTSSACSCAHQHPFIGCNLCLQHSLVCCEELWSTLGTHSMWNEHTLEPYKGPASFWFNWYTILMLHGQDPSTKVTTDCAKVFVLAKHFLPRR